MENGRRYASGEVAKRILVEPVTVRKYSQMLEVKGYIFERDDKDRRRYTEQDLTALQHLITLRQGGLSVEESVEKIADLYHHNLAILPTDTAPQQKESPFLISMKRQEEFNQKIFEQLEAQEKRQIERDENLIKALREAQEVKKQLAATQQNKWWQFWK